MPAIEWDRTIVKVVRQSRGRIPAEVVAASVAAVAGAVILVGGMFWWRRERSRRMAAIVQIQPEP